MLMDTFGEYLTQFLPAKCEENIKNSDENIFWKFQQEMSPMSMCFFCKDKFIFRWEQNFFGKKFALSLEMDTKWFFESNGGWRDSIT